MHGFKQENSNGSWVCLKSENTDTRAVGSRIWKCLLCFIEDLSYVELKEYNIVLSGFGVWCKYYIFEQSENKWKNK